MVADVEAAPHRLDDQLGDRVGALLLTRVGQRLGAVTHVRVTTFRETTRGRWDMPTRVRLAATLADGAPAVVDGRRVTEGLAEQRWLAWFPRPFGPHHAINVGGDFVDWTARRLPDLRVARSHLAARSWQAELLQAAGSVAGTSWGRRRAQGWVARGGHVADDDVRWACVVEATADQRDLVRAWAWGGAPLALAAALDARDPVARGEAARLPPPDLAPDVARRVLDDLAGDGSLRWSVTGPDPR